MKTLYATVLSFFVLIVLFFNTGCKDKAKYKKELVVLDTISVQLANVDMYLRMVDSLSLDKKIALVQTDLSMIDTLLPDTIHDKELAVLLMDHSACIAPLRQYPVKIKELSAHTLEMQTRINNLRSDLTKDIADEKQVDHYIETEKLNAKNLVSSLSLLNFVRDSLMKKIDSQSEIINGKITELEIIKKNKKK